MSVCSMVGEVNDKNVLIALLLEDAVELCVPQTVHFRRSGPAERAINLRAKQQAGPRCGWR